MHDEDHINTIFHFSTNILCFVVLSGYSIMCSEELFTLNSWVKKFLYNLSDTIKAFSILFVIDLCIKFHSPHNWELLIGYIYIFLHQLKNIHLIMLNLISNDNST
ncbi:chloroplast envelope membrane protein [Citrus sinensis]|uniref:Chloroplast envelope membrane protein n=1 Tax=Citrus sinensis TaxID=2711 RepID=A0ACB8JKY7_CITSI|nr:chloroplast envelope membrane protein [Citrus sinensis]